MSGGSKGLGNASCDTNGPRNVEKQNPAKQKPRLAFPILPVDSQESLLKDPKQRQFHAAIRVTPKRRDSRAQGALYREMDGIAANFCDAESLAKRYGETCH